MTIKDLRQEYGLSQQALADLIGIPKRTIENWEGNVSECKPYLLNLIGNFLFHNHQFKKGEQKMTINEYCKLYPEATECEIYVYDDDNHRHYHPEFVHSAVEDTRILDWEFDDISVELFDKDEYLSRWDVAGILSEDCIDDDANILMIFITDEEHKKFIEANP